MIWSEPKCIFKSHALTKGMEDEFTVMDQIKSLDEMTILIPFQKEVNFLDLKIKQNIFDVTMILLFKDAMSGPVMLPGLTLQHPRKE